jgi:hypothetical protein
VEFFAAGGRFWLPQEPRRAVHGDLVFDEGGLRLELTDPLRGPVAREGGGTGGSPQWAIEPIVHGRLRNGDEVTLLQASGYSMPVEPIQETWTASFALTGGLVAEDNFSRVWVVFDYLMPWTQPPGIFREAVTAASFTIDAQQSTLAEATLDGGRTVRLITGVEGSRNDASIHLDQWCAFEIEGESAAVIEILNDWVRPLQDLLVVCLGRPIRLDEILLGEPGHEPRPSMTRLSFNAVQSQTAPGPPAHVDGYTEPTLLTYARSPLPFTTLIAEWFDLCARLPAAIALLCGPYYAPFIYSQHRYASTFQSAEAVATAELAGREKQPSQHRQRVEAVIAALQAANLDPDTIRWATAIIRGRNEKPLHQLIQELIAATGEMGSHLLAAVPDLANRAAAARIQVSHPGDGRTSAVERYWIGEALVWVVRVHLLAQLGVRVSDLSARVVAKPTFQQLLAELRELASQASDLQAGSTSTAAADA